MFRASRVSCRAYREYGLVKLARPSGLRPNLASRVRVAVASVSSAGDVHLLLRIGFRVHRAFDLFRAQVFWGLQ